MQASQGACRNLFKFHVDRLYTKKKNPMNPKNREQNQNSRQLDISGKTIKTTAIPPGSTACLDRIDQPCGFFWGGGGFIHTHIGPVIPRLIGMAFGLLYYGVWLFG